MHQFMRFLHFLQAIQHLAAPLSGMRFHQVMKLDDNLIELRQDCRRRIHEEPPLRTFHIHLQNHILLIRMLIDL